MARSFPALFVLLGLAVQPLDAAAQVYSGVPIGYSIARMADLTENPTQDCRPSAPIGLKDCAAGPGMTIVTAFDYDGLAAVGRSMVGNKTFSYPIATREDLASALGIGPQEIVSIASTPERDAFYVAFGPDPYAGVTSPIARVELDGTARVVVTGAEQDAIAGGSCRVFGIDVAQDGTVDLILVGATYQLVRLDPLAAEGQRLTVLASVKDIVEAIGGVAESGPMLAHPRPPMTHDGKGRLFFMLDASIPGKEVVEAATVLIRRNLDGTFTEMTRRETYVNPEYDPFWYRRNVAFNLTGGLAWDPEQDVIAGYGIGIYLIDPDEPMHARQIVSPAGMRGLCPPEVNPGYALPAPGTCFERIGPPGMSIYGFDYGTWAMFSFDMRLLDVDDDFLTGHEETLAGTDPWVGDSDGGGIDDGAEMLDFTDPTAADDDRFSLPPPGVWVGTANIMGSAATDDVTFGDSRWGGATTGGEIYVTVKEGSDRKIARFTGPDEPMFVSGQRAPEGYFAVAADGAIVAQVPNEGVVRYGRNGNNAKVLELAPEQAIVGSTPRGTGIALSPDGATWVGYETGQLVRLGVDGSRTVVYDAWDDWSKAGNGSKALDQLEGSCFESCHCTLPIGPILFEPVRGIVLFWIQPQLRCPTGAGTMPYLVAVTPEGGLRVVADNDVLSNAIKTFGGMIVMDTEPDQAGGLWVLSHSLTERALLHLDASYRPYPAERFSPGIANGDLGGSSLLAHAVDLMVLPDGRLFTRPGAHSNQYPTTYGLMEIVPLEAKVAAGAFLVANPSTAELAVYGPDGGRLSLLQGEPLGAPVAVDATEDVVVVADAGRKSVLRFPVDGNGQLGPLARETKLEGPAGVALDAEGRAIVVDRIARRLVRIEDDGTVTELAGSDRFEDPADVVATASGAFVVVDAGKDALVRIGPDGKDSVVASIEDGARIDLLTGDAYVVSLAAGARWPVRIGADGKAQPLGGASKVFQLAAADVSGGVATDADGNAFWSVTTSSNWDKPGLIRTHRILRLTPDGHASALARYGDSPSDRGGDVSRVRGRAEPLPAEPGEAPLPVPDTTTAADASGGGDGGGGGAAECGGKSGCQAGVASAGAGALVPFALLLAIGFVARRRRAAPGSLVAAAIVLVGAGTGACGSTGGACPADVPAATTDAAAPDTAAPSELPIYVPEDVPDVCQGKTLCEPASPAVCESASSRRRCIPDEDGCWTWSQPSACPADTTCEAGVCTGPGACVPDCWLRTCGDDGCGGTCGSCAVPDSCCQGVCLPCKASCTDRECGWDQAYGSCGTCPAGSVCSAGKCRAPGKGDCREYMACIDDCHPLDGECSAACRERATQFAQYGLLAYEACASFRCDGCPAGDAACRRTCELSHCAREYGECYHYFGDTSCGTVFACTEGCAVDDAACIAACLDPATPEAYAALARLVVCVEAVCPPGSAGADACEDTAMTGACAAEAAACMGPCEPVCPPSVLCGPDSCTGVCGTCPDGQRCISGQCAKY